MTHWTSVFCATDGCPRSRRCTNDGQFGFSGWRCVTCRRALPTDHPEHLAPLPKRAAAERRQRRAEREAAGIVTTPRRSSAQVARERAVTKRLEVLHRQHLAAALVAEAVANGFSSWRVVEAASSGPRGPVREAAWQVRGRRSAIAEQLGWLVRWREAAQGMCSDDDLRTSAPSTHSLAQALLAEVLATADELAAVAS